jgi:hypothetical protein
MHPEGNSVRLSLDVEIERLCQALVNAAADWWAKRADEGEVIRVRMSDEAALEMRSGKLRTQRTA